MRFSCTIAACTQMPKTLYINTHSINNNESFKCVFIYDLITFKYKGKSYFAMIVITRRYLWQINKIHYRNESQFCAIL